MKKAAHSKRNRMRRALTGAGLTAACVIALVIAIAIGVQMPNAGTPPSSSSAQQQSSQSAQTQNTQQTADSHSSSPATNPASASTQAAPSEPTSLETSDSAVIENEGATNSSPIQVVSNGEDGIAAEHQASVVLVKLPDNLSCEDLSAQLVEREMLSGVQVDDTDAPSGWATLTLSDATNMADALDQLQACGMVEYAQPNYVYRLIRGTSDNTAVLPDGINGDNPPQVTGTGVQYDTYNYHRFVNDYRAKDEMVIITIMLREAYEYLRGKGYVSTISYDDGNVGTRDDTNALTWTQRDGYKRPTVAILDTGCDLDHEDLANIVDHYDAVYPDTWRGDIDEHGTHVAGIVSATTNNGVGITGVSLNAGLMAINVFDHTSSGLGADSKDIAKGYDYVIAHAREHNVRVVNLSLGSTTETVDNDDRLFLESISDAYGEGILTIIASGNDANVKGGAYCDFPVDFTANAISVIDCAVTDVNPNEGQASEWLTLSRDSYSNYNLEGTLNKQVSALGSFVLSTVPGTGNSQHKSYDSKNGTSMASPCVAGIAALLWQVDPSLTPEQVKSILYSTANDVTENPPNQSSCTDAVGPGFDLFTGFGTVNAYKAVVAADTGAYLSIVDQGETSVPVLGKGVSGARTIEFAAPEGSNWTWSSSRPNVASVSASGLVTAAGPGQTIISASNGSNTLYTTVTVFEPKMKGASTVGVGQTSTLSVEASPARAVWEWTSNDASVATVNKWSGKVTGKSVGKSAIITATLLSNPDVKVSKEVSVSKIDISAAKIDLSATKFVYSGRAVTPAVKSVTLNGSKLVEGRDYTVSYENNTNVGTARARVTGIGNYTGSAMATFAIERETANTSPGEASSGGGESSGESGGGDSGGGSDSGVTDVSMYRLYNPNSGEHFYTSSSGERDNLTGVGWKYESVGWTAPSSSGTPVYRMYNANGGEHHYTMSAGERDALVGAGWSYEGIGWYSDDSQRVPLYRDYNPNAFANNHNYTTSAAEHEMLMGAGWRSEGYAWYGM